MGFENYHIRDNKRTLWDIFQWKAGLYNDYTVEKPPERFHYPLKNSHFDPINPYAAWVNHSTFLIHFEKLFFLTDPIWSNKCSPLPFFGPKRKHPPGIVLEKLPESIAFVLISHDHYDHLDLFSVKKLYKLYPDLVWIVPLGVKKWFEKHHFSEHRVVEMQWGDCFRENFANGVSVKIHAEPAQHFSGRNMVNQNSTLWSSYVVELFFTKEKQIHKKIYFAGDTGYNPYDFKKIGQKWRSFDLALIPIGTYLPRRFMQPVHINPEEAVKIHKEIGSRLSIGMHWKTFCLSDEDLNAPPYDLFKAMLSQNLDPQSFLAIDPGTSLNF